MAWNLELSPRAQQQLDKLDKAAARRIVKFLYERVGRLHDPRQVGEPLRGTLIGLWRYRVGDYRIIRTFEHDRLVVLVLRIGHRREIYKR
jgi:mRNA interferase RelE/StbE